MDKLSKALNEMKDLLKGLAPGLKPKPNPLLASISQPSITAPKKTAITKAPKMPGIAPNTLKDPKKMAEQLKNPSDKKVKLEMLKTDKNGQWALEKSDLLDSEEWQDAARATRGFIKPDGEFIHLGNYGDKHLKDDTVHHGDVLNHMFNREALEQELGSEGASDHIKNKTKDWIEIGTGGAPHISGPKEILNNPRHPATAKARDMVAEHWSPVVGSMTMHGHKGDAGPLESIDANAFAKHGRIKPALE